MEQIKHLDDYRLVNSYLNGDEDAGRKLYEKTYVPLIAHVRKQCKGCGLTEPDFEDIVGEVMCRSVDKLDRFNGTSSFFTFLCGFAYNVTKETLRKKGKDIPTDPVDPILDFDSHPLADLSKYGISPEEYVIRKEGREQVSRALTQLRNEHQDYYDIIQLRIFNELPYAKIVELSGDSIDALESRFQRAIKAIGKIIKSF